MTKEYTPIIKLTGYRIEELQYSTDTAKLKAAPDGFHIEPTVGTNESSTAGRVTLDVSLKIDPESNKFDSRFVRVKVNAFFDISKELTDKDEIGRALVVNGTAIVFPYVRSIISMVTGLDSTQTVLLPTINTTEMFKNSRNSNNE
jgi:preprotein translocase subunit SecB